MTKFNPLIILILLLSTTLFAKEKPTLIFYCGITMVKPIQEMAKIIEKKHNCNIKISQGGSQDLYDALKYAKKGDLYLPGSNSYRKNNLKDGILLDAKYIGYNQAAIFVQKNNPKNLSSLDDLTNEKVASILCNPDSGSIGRITKKILTKAKGEEFFYDAYDYAALVGSDSRNINQALVDKKADMSINWKATALWDQNANYIDIIELGEDISPKKELYINLLKFSQNKAIAKSFMDFASSTEGQKIMKKYGFLD